MAPVIRIPPNIYSRLEMHAASGFDTPAKVIERLLDHYESSTHLPNEVEGCVESSSGEEKRESTDRKRTHHSVEDWRDHIEIVLGYKEGETNIGTPNWTRNAYKDLCDGEATFGAKGTNFMIAFFQVVKSHEPEKYESALSGFRKNLESENEKGNALYRLRRLYEEMSGNTLSTKNDG